MMTETGKCAICGEDYSHFGNNPAPLLRYEERVCNDCNQQVVIPVRLGAKGKLTTADGRVVEIE